MHTSTIRSGPTAAGRIAVMVAACVLLAVSTVPAAQGAEPAEFATKARNAVIMDAESGALLYSRGGDELVAPASMSKLMTLEVLFKALKAGTVKLSDDFLMSVNAWRRGGGPSRTAAMLVPLNTRVRLDELVQGIIVQSGNDASIAVAEGLSGTEEKFALRMTEEARALGMMKSVFKNATGLYDPDHLMTARELAVLARHIILEYPAYYPTFAQKEFKYRMHRFVNRNPLLTAGVGADGLKTGFVKESGYGIVGSAVQDGRRLIVVLAGLNSERDRKDETVKLLNYGFKNFAPAKVFDAGEVVGQARVWGGDRMYVPLTAKTDVQVWLSKTAVNPRIKGDLVYQYPLKAPIAKGDEVARLRVTGPFHSETNVPLYASEDVHPAGMVRRGLDTLVHLALRWATL